MPKTPTKNYSLASSVAALLGEGEPVVMGHIFAVLAEVGLPEAWREDGAGEAARKIARLMRDRADVTRELAEAKRRTDHLLGGLSWAEATAENPME
jgi:hypothetical protein